MSDRFRDDVPDSHDAYSYDEFESFPPLPAWIAVRLLRPDEEVSWVYGPIFNPSWERYVTHPGLFLLALAVGAFGVMVSWLVGAVDPSMLVVPVLAAGAIVIGSIFVLGIANGYFTRLVVTNDRIIILQGYEVCSSWNIDDLPRSLVRYRMRGDRESRSIDLDTLKTMMGGTSNHVMEAKTILSFGKQIEKIRTRERDRD